ncbi:MAG: acetylglutamate kinase [Anaerolineaceae bacterium]|nr:acetylglutamate kinase [Anaerolineaceae bacterium]MCB9099059.1 acetylglutamate kinase [Anaerolineales bacterium]
MLVLKIGGQELDDPEFIKRLGEAVAALPEPPILVHGGGKEIKELQTRLGLKPQYIDGLRVTDEESLDVVQMVLIGRINKRLVSCLSLAGVDAFGMSGVDRTSVKAEKLEHPGGDLGQVGRVTHVRTEVFSRLLEDGITPTLSPLCFGPDGSIFNVNADHVATAVAVAMQADELVFVSNVPGVLRDSQVLPRLTVAEVEQLITDNIIVDGMIPKTRSAFSAIEGGVAAVRITNLDGLKAGAGTTIIKH